MAFLSTVVILGGKNPLLVLFKSNIADSSGSLPSVLIAVAPFYI